MNMGFNTSSQSQKSVPASPISGNPMAALLANLFGVPASLDVKRGAFALGDPTTRHRFTGIGEDPTSGFGLSQPIFGTDTFQSLRDQLAPAAQVYTPELIEALSGAGVGGLGNALNLFGGSINPALEELVGTGFETDVAGMFEPIRSRAIQQLTDVTAPQLAQQFVGGTGSAVGPFSSDFLASLTRAAGGVETSLAAQQAEMEMAAAEAAAGRRVQGLPLAAELGVLGADLPMGFAQDLLGLSSAARAEELAGRPGGQLLQLLDALVGLPEVTTPGQVSKGESKGLGVQF
jgi:hypothetical protein